MMTGKEALDLRDRLKTILNCLNEKDEKMAFYYAGKMWEYLSSIIEIDRVSFNPTVKRDEEKSSIKDHIYKRLCEVYKELCEAEEDE